MRTDVTLESKTRKIIIDTKFYLSTLQEHHQKETIHSGNLYQMQSYLTNIEEKGGELNRHCEGILLYPTVNKELNLSYQFKNHKFQVKTINLNQDWKGIHERLMGIIQ